MEEEKRMKLENLYKQLFGWMKFDEQEALTLYI